MFSNNTYTNNNQYNGFAAPKSNRPKQLAIGALVVILLVAGGGYWIKTRNAIPKTLKSEKDLRKLEQVAKQHSEQSASLKFKQQY